MSHRLIHLNSMIDRQASDLYTTDWTTFLARPLLTSGKVSMKIKNIDLVNLFYTFGTESSILWVYSDYGGLGETLNSFQLSLTDTYDNGTTLSSYLTTLCTSLSLTFAYDTSTARMTVTNGGATTIRIVGSYRYSDDLANTYNNVIDRLGITQDLRTTTILAAGSLEAQSPLRLLRSTCYYLIADILSNTTESIVPTPYSTPHILGKISASNFGFVSQLQYSEEVYLSSSEKQIDKIHFSLLDDELYPVYSTNAPICITLDILFE